MPFTRASRTPARPVRRRGRVARSALIATVGLATVALTHPSAVFAQAASPEALQTDLVDAARAYDESAVSQLVAVESAQGTSLMQVLNSQIAIDAAIEGLRSGYVDKFGQEAWDSFVAAEPNFAAFSTSLADRLAGSQLNADGDSPTLVTQEGMTLPLVESDGGWKVSPPEEFPDTSQLVASYRQFADKIDRAAVVVPTADTPEAFATAFSNLPDVAEATDTNTAVVQDAVDTMPENMLPPFEATDEGTPEGTIGGVATGETPAPTTTARPGVPLPADQIQPAEPTARAKQLMDDLGHYSLIARPDLAAKAGTALLQEIRSPEELVAVVEDSRHGDSLDSIFKTLKRDEQSRAFAEQMEQRVRDARIIVSRDPARIRSSVNALTQGPQSYRNNVLLLREAGQFSAPALLEALQQRGNDNLRGAVLQAIVDIGEPVVTPLSVALPYQDVNVQIDLAQALARIGYPEPLPYLKQIIENQRTPAAARAIINRAYDGIASLNNVTIQGSASELFVLRGVAIYRRGTFGQSLPGLDPASETGWVWQYLPTAGQLLPLQVPRDIFPDALAMQAATNALELEPDRTDALTLFLAANLRRENRLPEGGSDPTYSQSMRPPAYYLQVAGPPQQNRVLDQALRDSDAALALDAILALTDTAGTPALLAIEGGQRPLLQALDNPNRLVRIRAAMALAAARPDEDFDGSYRVVRELTDAAGADATPHIILLAPTARRDALQAAFRNAGFDAVAGGTLAEVAAAAADRPGINLIVSVGGVDATRAVLDATASDYRFASVPVMAVTDPAEAQRLASVARENRRLKISESTGNDELAVADARSAIQESDLPNLTDQQRLEMATQALDLLREVAISSPVFKVQQGQAGLEATLDDPRPEVAAGAGRVLAIFNDADAQAAIANAALAKSGPVQVSLLDSLAESARRFGNMLPPATTGKLTDLVRTATGDLALAASRAHGALTLPTQNAVKNILADERGEK